MIRNVLNRHGLYQKGQEVPVIEEAVYQLTKAGQPPMKLTSREEQVLILSHYVYAKKIPLEVSNAGGHNVPQTRTGLYENLKASNVVDEKTLEELLNHSKTLEDIMTAARAIRRGDKNRERRAAKKAAEPHAGQSAGSLPNEAKAAVAPAATPSLVSMLYHR